MTTRILQTSAAVLLLFATAACDGGGSGGNGDEKSDDTGMVDADTSPKDTDTPPEDTEPGPDTADAVDTASPDSSPDMGEDAGGVGPPLQMVDTPSADNCGATANATLDHASVAKGHCAWVFAENVSDARGIAVDSQDHVLVVARGSDDLVSLHDDNGNQVIESGERSTLVNNGPGLNHGLRLHGGYLYASSATTVYRWPYTPGTESALSNRETVVKNIPTGGHSTRTLAAKSNSDWLYVNIGSKGNVTTVSGRATVMRYDLSSIPSGGYDWMNGELQAGGVRNEVALEFDPQGRLWGMQNGMDNLTRSDLGGDIHADNPGEELNMLDNTGEFHGYPYCWSEYILPNNNGMGRGTQWATPQFRNDGTHDDSWCQDTNNVRPPELLVTAHTAPLGMLFYQGNELTSAVQGDLIAALHGSWNRPTPKGYKVIRIPFDSNREPVRFEPFLEYAGQGAKDSQEWKHRFVEPAVLSDGTLLVTSDDSSMVVAVGAE